MKQLPGFDVARFDKLEDYTMALSYASTVHTTAPLPVDGLAELNILALIARGRINPTAFKNYTVLTGYKNIASDLQIQGQILKGNWTRIEGKCEARSRSFVELTTTLGAPLSFCVGTRRTPTPLRLRSMQAVAVRKRSRPLKRAFPLAPQAPCRQRRPRRPLRQRRRRLPDDTNPASRRSETQSSSH